MCSWYAKRKMLCRRAERGGSCVHLVSLMQQQPVYIRYSQICICERCLHHLHKMYNTSNIFICCCYWTLPKTG